MWVGVGAEVDLSSLWEKRKPRDCHSTPQSLVPLTVKALGTSDPQEQMESLLCDGSKEKGFAAWIPMHLNASHSLIDAE